MTWYKDWFNSQDYLLVYKHRDSREAEILVKLIQKKMNLLTSSYVLDMACGAGRHSIAFAKKGYNVTAVDLSERLIYEAEKNAIHENVNIDFVQADIRDLKLDKQFDLIVNLFTSFGYFETDEENFIIIQKAYDLLKPGGYFVLDYLNKNYLEKNLVPSSKFIENGTSITQKRAIKYNRVEKEIIIEKNKSVNKFYESVRMYDFDELKDILEGTGFRISNTFGDFNGNIFEQNSSPRLVIFAEK
jgi:SAM-dependent methyltransferase